MGAERAGVYSNDQFDQDGGGRANRRSIASPPFFWIRMQFNSIDMIVSMTAVFWWGGFLTFLHFSYRSVARYNWKGRVNSQKDEFHVTRYELATLMWIPSLLRATEASVVIYAHHFLLPHWICGVGGCDPCVVQYHSMHKVRCWHFLRDLIWKTPLYTNLPL